MDRPGEIDYLGEIVQPDVGVITNIGDAHIERLGSRENIFRAKCELLPHIRPGGLVVLNGDDPMLASLRGRTPVPAVFCGREEGLEYRARRLEGDGDSRILCQMTTPRMDRQVEIPALGEHMIYPALIAAAIGERFGLTQDQIVEGILRFVPTRMRMNILYRGDGIVILDDTYNANPQSMRAAISVLSDRRSQWSIAVLGDMFELGPFAPALHTGVGECLGKARIDCLVAVGELARAHRPGGPELRRAPGVPLQRQGGGQACPGPAGPAGQHHFSEGVPRDGAGGADRLPALHHPGGGVTPRALPRTDRLEGPPAGGPFPEANTGETEDRYDRYRHFRPGQGI